MKTLVFLSLLMCIQYPIAQGQRTADLRKATEKIIRYDTKITYEKIPGFICGMIDGDSTYIVDFGSADRMKDVRMDEHTVFEVGSLSKVFTISLLAALVDEGMLSFRDSLHHFIPEYANPHNPLTIRDLAMHRSGLPKLPKDFGLKEMNPQDPFSNYTKEDLLSFYSTFRPREGDKDKYVYSHCNFALLEIVMEKRTGKPFPELLDEKLLLPLGMYETGLSISEHVIAKAAKGYALNGRETKFRTFPSFAGALGIKTTLHDLLILVRSYMGLQNESYQEIFSSCFRERRPIDLVDRVDIAYGWHIIRQKKYFDIIVHPGRGSGHQVSLHFIPETKTAVIVLANALESLDNLGYMMLALVNNHWKMTRKQKRMLK